MNLLRVTLMQSQEFLESVDTQAHVSEDKSQAKH